MGYCYSKSGGLLCDFCGGGGAKKHRCPFGWCQPAAACDDCRARHASSFGRAAHRGHGCESNAKAFDDRNRREAELKAAGVHVRRSALSIARGVVQVLFSNGSEYVGRFMLAETYRGIALTAPATVADFEALGQCWEAPAEFITAPELPANVGA